MNEENEELAALGGSGESAGEATDYKAELEKTQKMLQSERVEAGRLKKANEELAELRKQVAELQAKKRTDMVLDELDAETKETMPDDYQRGMAKIAQSTVDHMLGDRLARLEEKSAREEQMTRRQSEASFVLQIKSTYPGFLESIGKGGDKQESWTRYQRINAETLKAAIDRCDFDTLSYHISNFYNTFLGVPAPSGGQEESAPDPRAYGGGVSQNFDTGNGRFYTVNEYKATLEKAQNDFQNHKISYAQYSKVCDDLSTAYKQGRVKA